MNNNIITVTFNRPLDRSTITASTFDVAFYDATSQDLVSISGTRTFIDSYTVKFTPDAALRPGVRYVVQVQPDGTSIKDQLGKTLCEGEVVSFETVPNLFVTGAGFVFKDGNSACLPGDSNNKCDGVALNIVQAASNSALLLNKPR